MRRHVPELRSGQPRQKSEILVVRDRGRLQEAGFGESGAALPSFGVREDEATANLQVGIVDPRQPGLAPP